MVKTMRARSHIAVPLVFVIGVPLAWSVEPSIAAAQPSIYATSFTMAPIPGTINISQTALKAGDRTVFAVDVHSGFAYPPIISADVSELGVLSPTTTPARFGSPNYDSNSFYTFGPFTIGADIPDGSKTISVTATDIVGSTTTATAHVVVDSLPPIITLSNIAFSTTSPQQGDFMYLSGSLNGTGTKIVSGSILETLLNADKNERGPWPYHRAAYDPQQLIKNAFASSTDGTFTNVPFRLNEGGISGDIKASSFLRVDMSVSDEAGNFASTSLTVPIPKPAPPDPCAVPGSCISNVLFLPGIEGSRLYEGIGCGKTAEEKLWEPVADSVIQMLRGAGDDKVRSLSLNQSGGSVCDDIYAKESDILDSVRGSNIYASLNSEMSSLKTDGSIIDWKPVAYDWRLSLDDLLTKGAERNGKIYYEEATSTPYIEQTLRALAATSKTGKVSIIAHSNGGLLAKALLNKLGGETAKSLVDKVILVAVPQSGAPTAVGAALFGYDAGIYTFGFPIVSNAVARSLAQNSPMAYHLLPSEDYFESTMGDAAHPIVRFAGAGYAKEEAAYGSAIANRAALDGFLLAKEGGRRNPAANEVNDAAVLNSALIDYANGVHDTLDNWIPPQNIEVDQIAGWGADTVAGIDFYTLPSQLSVLTSTVPVRAYRPIFTEDGDGTVPVPSALMMASSTSVKRYWVNLDSYYKETKIKRTHRNIFEIPSLQDFIKNIIENSTSTLPSFISSGQPSSIVNDKKLTFFLHSPLTLELKDPSGNVTGLAPDGSVAQNIPGAVYGEFGEVKYIIAPQGSSYQLAMHGQGNGIFSLDIQESSGEIITASSTIANIPTTASTSVSLTISDGLTTASPLTVDENGDGKDTITIAPQSGETVAYSAPAVPTASDASTAQPPQVRPADGQERAPISAGSISIPVIIPVHISPTITTATPPAASIAPAATPSIALTATAPQLSIATPHVSARSPAPPSPATRVANILPKLPQTASVYEASQPSILKKIGAALYNGLHGLWVALRRLF